jgi:tetratricopeptide (TPR) repeat protein
MMGEVGFALRAAGRLADAIQPTRAGAAGYVKSESWKNAAISHNNLSELHLILGNVAEAVGAARDSVDFADRSGDAFERSSDRTTLADALHQSGDLAGAERLFVEADLLQAELGTAFLYSLQGYRYCDLLLAQGRAAEVLSRASETLKIAEQCDWLLEIGLDHLALGRAYLGSDEGAKHLDQAIEFLRRSGQVYLLPLGLLARGTAGDLEEALRIASRSGMRLYLADYHLAAARPALGKRRLAQAREHFEKAEALIHETGYHRRDLDLERLRSALTR